MFSHGVGILWCWSVLVWFGFCTNKNFLLIQLTIGKKCWCCVFFDYVDLFAAIILGINANPVFAKDISTESSFESSTEGDDIIELRKVEDGSVISNIHTSKWRIFTDCGKDFFLQASISGIHDFVIFITLFAVLCGFLELFCTFFFPVREKLRRLKSCSFLQYKKLKKVLVRGIHMSHLPATIWWVHYWDTSDNLVVFPLLLTWLNFSKSFCLHYLALKGSNWWMVIYV